MDTLIYFTKHLKHILQEMVERVKDVVQLHDAGASGGHLPEHILRHAVHPLQAEGHALHTTYVWLQKGRRIYKITMASNLIISEIGYLSISATGNGRLG